MESEACMVKKEIPNHTPDFMKIIVTSSNRKFVLVWYVQIRLLCFLLYERKLSCTLDFIGLRACKFRRNLVTKISNGHLVTYQLNLNFLYMYIHVRSS